MRNVAHISSRRPGWSLLVTALLAAPLMAAEPVPLPTVGSPLFEEMLPADTGAAFVHRLDVDHPLAYLYHSGYACAGVCIGDVNGDGRPDIFLASGPDVNALFLNKGGWRFEKKADSGVEGGSYWAAGAAMADIDADGDLDIYVCHYDAPNHLYLNDGAGKFKEAGFSANLAAIAPSLSPYFADFDGDGDLDLFLLTNRFYSAGGYPRERAWERGPDGKARMKEQYDPFFRLVTPPWGKPADDPFIQEYGHPDRIYRNDGPGTDGTPRFRDITAGSGIEDADGHGLSALVCDFNGDGRTDIYVANDYIDPDRLWINQGAGADGRVHFKDQTADHLPYTSWFSMGSDAGDINNDGLLDFLVGDMAATTHFKAKTTMGEMFGLRRWVMENGWPRQSMRNCLFINTGAARWQEAAFLAGIARSDWTWSIKFGDYDLDGLLDVFLTNGIARTFSDSDIVFTDAMRVGKTEWDLYKDAPEMRERDLAFRNEGSLRFRDVSASWGVNKENMSYGAATGDLDGDGDLDLVVCNLTENVSLFQNRAADRKSGHWLSVRLDGAKHRSTIGAEVAVTAGDRSFTRWMNPVSGFLSSNDPVLHFGLGSAAKADSIRVRWPGGKVSLLKEQTADRMISIREPEAGESPAPPAPAPPAAWFVEGAAAAGLAWKHADESFNDYEREFLLPQKLSQSGPGLAAGDVNGDKKDDVFVCGGTGQAGSLFIAQTDGRFIQTDGPWQSSRSTECAAPLFFDADRDGDLDLFVAAGSNEKPAGDPLYAGHLYLNDSAAGRIAFLEAPACSLTESRRSIGAAVAADFDRDGDLDLFTGARSVPGAYLVIPDSILWRNDSSKPGEVRFTDVTDTLAPGLKKAGMVTAALFTDANGDGWIDLLVACEWGPVRLFLNQSGVFTDVSKAAGMENITGWWNSLAAGDFDRDGDLDYAALNAGLNTKYGHPTVEKSLTLYRADMDGNGSADLIEAKGSQGGELPVRGRSCSSTAMPFIKDKFKTYKSFAASSLADIYSQRSLTDALKVTANTLESGIWINESKAGAPKFAFRALPPEAQLSPGYGAVVIDADADGWMDLCFSENCYGREPETGLWRGGAGCVLQGSAAGFTAASLRCGFIVPGDGKGLAALDFSGDGRPDLIALQNNDQLLAFAATKPSAGSARTLAVRLSGPPGNPACTGARVTVLDGALPVSVSETSAGSGFQSQSSATVFLSLPRETRSASLRITWPDGRSSDHAWPENAPMLDLSWPPAK